jgi:hypothetical protein
VLSQSDIKEAFETAPEVLNVIRKQAVAAAGQRDRARQLGTAVGGGTPKHTKDTGQKLLGNTSDSSTAADGGN